MKIRPRAVKTLKSSLRGQYKWRLAWLLQRSDRRCNGPGDERSDSSLPGASKSTGDRADIDRALLNALCPGCPAPRLFVGTGHVQRRIIAWELARGLRRDLTRQWVDAVFG
jgi:hypothetical protein